MAYVDYEDFEFELIRNPKIKSLIHFNKQSALPTTSELNNNDLKNKNYRLIDAVPENRIQVMGTQWKYVPAITYDTDGKYSPYTVKKAFHIGGRNSSVFTGAHVFTPYPFILGGQDFTIEIGISFNNINSRGPIFAFSPFDHYKPISKDYKTGSINWDNWYIESKEYTDNMFSLEFLGNYFKIVFPRGTKTAPQENSVNFRSPHYIKYWKTKILPQEALRLYSRRSSEYRNYIKSRLPDNCDYYAYTEQYLQLVFVYKHNPPKGEEKFIAYINGFKVRNDKKYYEEDGETFYETINAFSGDDSDLFSTLKFPRTGFLYGFLGKYATNRMTSYLDASIDEFRICDGVAVTDYTGNDLYANNYGLSRRYIDENKVKNWDNDKDQPKLIFHFNNVTSSNLITPPKLIEFYPKNVGFDYELEFNGNHQYLELMRDQMHINTIENVIQTDKNVNSILQEPENDYTYNKRKYWKTGIILSGQNFTLESFLKIYKYSLSKNDYEKIMKKKKLAIFEFNKNGCSNVKYYFRMIVDMETEELIVEQCGITSSSNTIASELIRAKVPMDYRFHWFLCYHKNTNKLKLYVDSNEMEGEYVTNYFYPRNPDNIYQRLRVQTTEIKGNINKIESTEPVTFKENIEFQQFVIGTNVAPISGSESSYSYSNSFVGTMDEFRIVDGHAVEPYTPEHPYEITDPTTDWDDE